MRCALLLLGLAGTVLANHGAVFPEDLPLSRNRIVSGSPAEEGQFPYQISMRMVSPAGGVNACGGTIISEEWALTAAHCTAGRVTLVIRAGVTNLTKPFYIFETSKYFNHPRYNPILVGQVQQHDIGLVGFERSISFNDYVKPIRLQNSASKNRDYHGQKAIASGFGRTWTQGSSTEHLNWVNLRLTSNHECFDAYWGQPFIGPSTICTRGYDNPTQSTCQGDSGGPLTTIDNDGAITQVGVTSFVSHWGCHAGIPSGFVRPGHYHEWFTQVTGINFDWEYPLPSTPGTESPGTPPGIPDWSGTTESPGTPPGIPEWSGTTESPGTPPGIPEWSGTTESPGTPPGIPEWSSTTEAPVRDGDNEFEKIDE